MQDINTWWEGIPGERFWLGVAGLNQDRGHDVLSAPEGPGRPGHAAIAPLITHVKAGDVVFHFDDARQAIVGWSVARGRVVRRTMKRSDHEREDDRPVARVRWSIALEPTTPLDDIVPLAEIARVQWDLFPALRAFEDRVGEPLYYPFAMGSASDTRLLAGHVFKLPGLFIERFSSLARVAQQMRWSVESRTRATDRADVAPASSRAPATRRDAPSPARDTALGAR